MKLSLLILKLFCFFDKAQLFWEGHKNLRNLSYLFLLYLVNVQTMRKIAQILLSSLSWILKIIKRIPERMLWQEIKWKAKIITCSWDQEPWNYESGFVFQEKEFFHFDENKQLYCHLILKRQSTQTANLGFVDSGLVFGIWWTRNRREVLVSN